MTQAPREDLVHDGIARPNAFVIERAATPRPDQKFVGASIPRPVDDQVTGYAVDGRETDHEPSMAAKKVSNGAATQYFVRYGTSGADMGRPLDPCGVGFKLDDLVGSRKHRGRLRYEFKAADPQAFALYLKYLQVRTAHLLVEVERIQNA